MYQFIYIRGLQRQIGYDGRSDLQSIQGVLEYGFSKLFNTEAQLKISSRTDVGVHALESTAHFTVNEGIL